MVDLREAGRGAAPALRGRVGRDELRVRLFELLQLVVERVVGAVGNLRVVEDVVAVVVVLDEPPELGDPPNPRQGGMQLLRRVDERVGLLAEQSLVGMDPAPADCDRAPRQPWQARMSNGESPT